VIRYILTILSSLLEALGVVPYWWAAWQGKARANIVSWFTWTLLTLIIAAAAFSSNDWRVGLVVLGNALGTSSVVVLGFWRGYARLTRFDVICQIVALLGLVSWLALHTILPAVLVTITIDAVALLPTIRHAWHKPAEEAWLVYALQSAGSLCALLSSDGHSLSGHRLSSLYVYRGCAGYGGGAHTSSGTRCGIVRQRLAISERAVYA
jgi:hypothetical protein